MLTTDLQLNNTASTSFAFRCCLGIHFSNLQRGPRPRLVSAASAAHLRAPADSQRSCSAWSSAGTADFITHSLFCGSGVNTALETLELMTEIPRTCEVGTQAVTVQQVGTWMIGTYRHFNSTYRAIKLFRCKIIFSARMWAPNVMVALPNTGGALCSTPQSLADAHY